MHKFGRIIKETIIKQSFKGKIIILSGPRQVGKTTLIKTILDEKKFKSLNIKIINCDNPTSRVSISNKDLDYLSDLIGSAKILFIDEGQKAENIGDSLKLLVDHYGKDLQIFITGSSSINLLDMTQEPLTGRKFVNKIYPLALSEIYEEYDPLKIQSELEKYLIFGLYPEVVSQKSKEDKITLLTELCSSYLYKDILEFQEIKNPSILEKLLRALALQIGQEVSYNELSNLLGIDKSTVERYVDLLEKSYVIFRLSPFVQNKRKELSKLRKIYFYDLGIRNTIINNFNPLDFRDDKGGLFENFLVVERLKYREYKSIHANQYFWRSYDSGEIDLVEEMDGKLYGYEFKFSKKNVKPPNAWMSYKNASFDVISKEYLKDFLF